MTRIRAIAARRSRRVWLLWLIGAAVLLAGSLAIADPAVVALVLDPELVALLVGTAVGMLRFRLSEGLDIQHNRRKLTRCARPPQRRLSASSESTPRTCAQALKNADTASAICSGFFSGPK